MLCLCREKGLLAVAGLLYCALRNREWRHAVWTAAAAVPFLVWAMVVTSHFSPHLGMWVAWTPFKDTLAFLFNPPPSAHSGVIEVLVRASDLLALGGLALGFWFALRRGTFPTPLAAIAAFYACLGIYLLSLDEWTHVYDFGRVLSPMLLALGLRGMLTKRLPLLLPSALIGARVAAQLVPQALGVVGW